jgi:hypothetical protein
MFVCCKRDVITFIRGCSDLRKRTSVDTRVMYLDRDYFRSSWLWFANYRHVELWNPERRARGFGELT